MRRLTGLPVDYYVITGFPGLMAMVDELGGVDVFVDRRMNDRNSGARFQRGWHHFTGGEALAFSRDRTDVERGDLTRSEHQGLIMLSALAKMRAEVADDAGVARWIGVLVKHTRLDVPLAKLPAHVRHAVLAAEDARFYHHPGVDATALARAVWHNLLGHSEQGGSTITQQLAKIELLGPEQSVSRKLQEGFLAWAMERRYTKNEILEMYLNRVYYGHGAYGLASAVKTYFGRDHGDTITVGTRNP